MHLDVLNPARAVEQAILACLHDGDLVSPRGVDTLEITNATFVIAEPWQVPFELEGRGLRPFIGAVEALQLVGQTSAPELTGVGSPPMSKYTDHGTFHGAYGQRVYGRLGPLVDLLKADPETRGAVLSIYDANRDLAADVKDVPCTLSLQFLIRGGRLCARTSMRSNDVFLGLPYDLVQFAALQGAVAMALDQPMGWYSHTVGSLHLYRRDVDKAETLRAPRSQSTLYQPLWGDGSIGGISRFCRQILLGAIVAKNVTPFETFLIDAVLPFVGRDS